jgi:tetraacyldisaccharide 4'-kinase
MSDLASRFNDLVSGRRKGIAATVARGALRLAEVPYSLAVRLRNRQFDNGAKPIERVGVPVVSVGNITLGGTGKTPMVEWLCRRLRDRGIRAAIVSRGYKTRDRAANDEALELAEKLPGMPHVQNPDRVAAAQQAIAEFACGAIVLDDGFQHRRIARDLDIVLLDSQAPFGFDHVFPRGTLREPLVGLARADCIVLTRADIIVPDERERIRQRALSLSPRALWAECVHKPIVLVTSSGSETPLDALRGQRVAAFCGIGNPAGFRHTLASCGYEVSLFREFADHHAYPAADVASLDDWSRHAEVAAVLCTQKDLVKINRDRLGDKPLYALRIGMEFVTGQNELEAQLDEVVSPQKGEDAA